MPVSQGLTMLKCTFSGEPRPKKHHSLLSWNARLLSCSGIPAEWTLSELAHWLRAASWQNHNHNHIQVGQTGHYKILGVGQSQRGRNSTRSSVGRSQGFAERREWSVCHFKASASTFLLMSGLFGDRYLEDVVGFLTDSSQRILVLKTCWKHQIFLQILKLF